MAIDWVSVLGALVSWALVVAFSPLPVIAVLLLMLHTARPKSTGMAFLVGRLVGVAGLAILCTKVPDLVGRLDRPIPRWTDWAGLALGILLVVFGIWRWRNRGPAATISSTLFDRIGRISPGGAAVLGLGIAVLNGKVLLASAGAGVAIGAAELSFPLAVAALTFYVVLASSTVIVPVVGYAIAAERIGARLERGRRWIERHQSAVTAVASVLFGVALIVSTTRSL